MLLLTLSIFVRITPFIPALLLLVTSWGIPDAFSTELSINDSALTLGASFDTLRLKEFKVLTFNIQRHDNSIIAQFTDLLNGRPPVQARIEATIDILRESDADIIALQEVSPEFLRTLMQKHWISEYNMIHTFQSNQLSASYYLLDPIGQIILSRYNITASTYKPLVKSRLARKYLQADIHIEDQSFLVTNIHLDSFSEDGDIRAAQLQQVFASTAYSTHSLVLGDYNFSENQTPESNHLPHDYSDVWLILKPIEEGITYEDSNEKGRLDRILFRAPGWEPVRVDLLNNSHFRYNDKQMPISDHRALTMIMKTDIAYR